MECFVSAVIASLPASADKLAKYKSAQPADSICQKSYNSVVRDGQNSNLIQNSYILIGEPDISSQ